MTRYITAVFFCLMLLCAANCASAQEFMPGGDALEYSIMAYSHGELYMGTVLDTVTQQFASYSVGEQDGLYGCFVLAEYGEMPGGRPDWVEPELAKFGGDLQQVKFHGATFTIYSAEVDWIEIEVRGCPSDDIKPYLIGVDLSNGLDESILDKLYRPLGRVAFAANQGAPVPWPVPVDGE